MKLVLVVLPNALGNRITFLFVGKSIDMASDDFVFNVCCLNCPQIYLAAACYSVFFKYFFLYHSFYHITLV